MSGPRVTSGEASKQDYRTPNDFMAAVAKRFGAPTFDLAAHAGNHQFDRYYAPREFVVKVERGKNDDLEAVIADVVRAGADAAEARRLTFEQWAGITGKGKIVIPNRDANAAAFDALRLETGARRRWAPHLGAGLGWLNCEFADVGPWAEACGQNVREDGVRSLLLTPAVFAGWHIDHVVGVADVYELSGRLCFDGKSPFPKDCRLSHFHPGATGKVCIWDWRRNVILAEWARSIPDLGTTAQGESSFPNARGVDGAAAIPRSENDGKPAEAGDRNATQTGHLGNAGRPPMSQAARVEVEVVNRPGEQRPILTDGEIERFHRSYDRSGGPNACWNWLGKPSTDGYGFFGFRRIQRGAHRISFLISVGEIPEGLSVLHRCDNRICVNPAHLFLGTHRDNMADMVSKGRQARGEATRPETRARGESCSLHKLTEQQVIEIRSSGITDRSELARRFGVDRKTIRLILTGETWAHVGQQRPLFGGDR